MGEGYKRKVGKSGVKVKLLPKIELRSDLLDIFESWHETKIPSQALHDKNYSKYENIFKSFINKNRFTVIGEASVEIKVF